MRARAISWPQAPDGSGTTSRTLSGPVAWDLAASTASQRLDGARILTAYGTPVDTVQLAVCEQLRRLHLTVWYALYAERLPEHRQRAAELLASWRV